MERWYWTYLNPKIRLWLQQFFYKTWLGVFTKCVRWCYGRCCWLRVSGWTGGLRKRRRRLHQARGASAEVLYRLHRTAALLKDCAHNGKGNECVFQKINEVRAYGAHVHYNTGYSPSRTIHVSKRKWNYPAWELPAQEYPHIYYIRDFQFVFSVRYTLSQILLTRFLPTIQNLEPVVLHNHNSIK